MKNQCCEKCIRTRCDEYGSPLYPHEVFCLLDKDCPCHQEEPKEEIRIKPGEGKIFDAESFTLGQDGNDLIAIPQPPQECEHEWGSSEPKCNFATGDHQHCGKCGVVRKTQPQGVSEEWEKEFDNFFVKKHKNLGESWRLDRGVISTQKIKDFIRQLLSSQRKELLNTRELPPAIGISQWRNYGEKYGYDKYFKVIKDDKINRVEVINHSSCKQNDFGRCFVHWSDEVKVTLDIQDNERTLKIFLDDK